MKIIRRTAEYTVLARGDGRYAVRGSDKQWINGDPKVEILVREGLLKERPTAGPQPGTGETPAEEAAEASATDDAEEKIDEAS